MGNYLFPVRIENGKSKLLPHVAAEIPTEFTFTSSDDIPVEIASTLEKLHPNKEFDNFHDIIDALEPNTGILTHELHSKPHSVLGYHEDMSEQEAREMINEIEDRLGHELKETGDLEPLSSEKIEGHWPKTAGWNKSGDFVAQ